LIPEENPHAIAGRTLAVCPKRLGKQRRRLLRLSRVKLGRPKTAGQWIGHFAMAIIALFLVWWMLRVYAH
jgi:hypothetical protein